MGSPSKAFTRLLEVLDRMEIQYEIGGSAASSAHGIPRTTLDVDMIVDLRPEQIDAFADELRGDFYVEATMIREAFERNGAANLIHLETAWKFDLFPLRRDEYSQVEFGRRAYREVRLDGGEAIECVVASAEDTILRKLEWYRAGRERSERQWNDLRGICQARGGQLDVEYLSRWAGQLKVGDLLEKLLAEFSPKG